MRKKNIREICGEIWAEAQYRILNQIPPYQDADVHLLNDHLDLIMSVLARYSNYEIVNDDGLPVEPLPIREFDD
jgi:hypothetical protein